MSKISSLLNLWDFESAPYQEIFQIDISNIPQFNLEDLRQDIEYKLRTMGNGCSTAFSLKEEDKKIIIDFNLSVLNKKLFFDSCIRIIFNSYINSVEDNLILNKHNAKKIQEVCFLFKHHTYPENFSNELIFLDLLNIYYPNNNKNIKNILMKKIELLFYNQISFRKKQKEEKYL